VPDTATETAYYLNHKLKVVALVAKGVRFPSGRWIRVADSSALSWVVERMLAEVFPELKGVALTFVSLTSEFEVKEFEHSFRT